LRLIISADPINEASPLLICLHVVEDEDSQSLLAPASAASAGQSQRCTGPLVTFARSGASTPFPTSAGSLLELADACDVPSRWSCRPGFATPASRPALRRDQLLAGTAGAAVRRPGSHLLARPDTEVVLDM
jgi:hypothetical protein